MKKLVWTLGLVLLFSITGWAKGSSNSKFRYDLGVAHPNYLGDSSPVGILANDGFGVTAQSGSFSGINVIGLGLHYGHDNFALGGSYFEADTTPKVTGDEIMGAVRFSMVSLGVNDDIDVGLLFNISNSFRVGIKSETDSANTDKTNTLGLAWDMSSVTLALDYATDEDDDTHLGVGVGFNGGGFFAGVKHTMTTKKIGADTDKSEVTLGYGRDSWLLAVAFSPNDAPVDDDFGVTFTYNF